MDELLLSSACGHITQVSEKVATRADRCVGGALELSLGPPPPAAAAATPLQDAPPPPPAASALNAATLCDEAGEPIGAPLPLPALPPGATHAVPLRLCASAAGPLLLTATTTYKPAEGAPFEQTVRRRLPRPTTRLGTLASGLQPSRWNAVLPRRLPSGS